MKSNRDKAKDIIKSIKKNLNNARYAELYDIFSEIDIACDSLRGLEDLIDKIANESPAWVNEVEKVNQAQYKENQILDKLHKS